MKHGDEKDGSINKDLVEVHKQEGEATGRHKFPLTRFSFFLLQDKNLRMSIPTFPNPATGFDPKATCVTRQSDMSPTVAS